jgi:cyclophilin family peptidyl-prolyl cis-trans isomerase
MLDRIWKAYSSSDRHGAGSRPAPTLSRRRPSVEVLEDRQLLTAALATITSFSVPAQLGYQLALDGSKSTSSNQTFTATSSNPNIQVSVAQGQFWTVTVSHTPASSSDVTITNETMTFQLFGDLTPQTVARITTLTNDGYYTNGFPNQNPPVPAGQFVPRITSVANSGFSVIQGGSSSATSTASSSGLTPTIATEPLQQLAFTGQNQIAMAHLLNNPNSNDAQFFITNGVPSQSTQQAFDFNYTIFGQLVSGQQTVTDLSKVAVQAPTSGGEVSQPITPVTINAVGFSSTNRNGVLHIDTTSAKAAQTATITVTATDPTDHTTATQSFTVTVGAYNGPTIPVINFVPFASAVSASTNLNTPVTVQLSGQSGFPTSSTPGTLTYKLVSQPVHGTISQFNSSAGTLVYTPGNNNFGPDTFQYQVVASGPQSGPNDISSLPATATITVGAVNTGAVRLIGTNVLVVTPLPRTDHGTDNIRVMQQADSTVSGGQKIVVMVNGIPDLVQPPANSLNQIVVFGTKANTNIQVDPNVDATVPVTLDGGHGGKNVIQGGSGSTREHGWFGHTLLIGGPGFNALIGRKGFVRFKPSTATKLIYAGVIKPRGHDHRTVAPSGTYYRFVKGRLVPVLTT